MKGCALVVFFACASVTLAKPTGEEEMKKMVMEAMMSCKESVGASDSDLEIAFAYQPAVTPEGRCMETCVMAKTGAVIDGKINTEITVNFADAHSGGNAEAMAIARQIAEGCGSISAENPCDLWHNYAECLMTSAQALGVDPTTLM